MILTILYPAEQTARFDEGYYAGRHIPMLQDMWADLIERVDMISFPPDGDGPAPCRMMTIVHFHDAAALGAAMAHPRMAELQADVAVFTDCVPQAHVGVRAKAG